MIKTIALPVACALALAFTLSASRADAAVCVALDATKDNLTEQDRAGAVTLLAQALQQQGLEVASQGCLGTYVVYHVRLGASVTVSLQGPQGYRQATVRAIEELPAIYSQMVRSLITGLPMGTENGTVDRGNVTSAQQAPNRVEADSLWYLRLGYAGALGPFFNAGPSFGFGYRYELDRIGVDVSFLNLMVASDRGNAAQTSSVGVTGSWVKLMGLYFADPMANASLYFGGGVSWGATGIANQTTTYTGSGLQAEAVAGYEFLRASSIRIFLEAEATLPLYTATQDFNVGGVASGRAYVPTFGLSFGLGWGRSIARVHIVP